MYARLWMPTKTTSMYHFPFAATSHNLHSFIFTLVNSDFHLYMIIATAWAEMSYTHYWPKPLCSGLQTVWKIWNACRYSTTLQHYIHYIYISFSLGDSGKITITIFVMPTIMIVIISLVCNHFKQTRLIHKIKLQSREVSWEELESKEIPYSTIVLPSSGKCSRSLQRSS